MALLRGGRARVGQAVSVHDADRRTLAKVVPFPFYDPAGERMNG
jgi:glycine cleavage system aminomethyltransferase T